MNWTAAAVMSVAGALVLGACGTAKRVGRATSDLVTGSKPDPESVWNGERTWRRVGETPPTYVPTLYRKSSMENGEWFVDKRDGKRLFVPTGGVEGIPESVLRAEAWMATGKGDKPLGGTF